MHEKRGIGRGIQGVVNLDALADICQGVEWPAGLVPAHPQARRLLAALGVVGMPAVTALDVHALTATSFCVHPLCVDEALAGLEHCRRHAPIAELRANGSGERPPGSNGRLAWTRETIINAIQAWAEKHGQPPSSGSGPMGWIKAADDHPNVATVVKHFKSWRAGIEAAGLTPLGNTTKAKRHGRAPKAPEKGAPSAPSLATAEVSPPSPLAVVAESPESVGAERGARPDEPSSEVEVAQQEPPSPSDGFLGALALTGDFTRDAFRVRNEAAKLRAQAEALDVIATGIDRLAETVA